jgi:hypothetical protein
MPTKDDEGGLKTSPADCGNTCGNTDFALFPRNACMKEAGLAPPRPVPACGAPRK